MSEAKKLSKDILIYGISNGLQSLVPFFMLPILTSAISAEGYGLLSLIETSVLFLIPFIMLNLEAGILVEFYKVEKKELNIYITNGILISLSSFLIISILFFITHNFIAKILAIPPELILLLPILVILRLIPTIVLVLYQAEQSAIKYLTFSISQTIVDFSLSVFFVMVIKYGYVGRLSSIYLAFFLFTIIGIFVLYKRKYINYTFSKRKIVEILKFGVPLIPHTIGGIIIIMSGRYFISYFKGNSLVGLYTVAYQIGGLVLLFSRSVNQAWSPILFNLLKEKKIDNAFKITKILFVLFILVCGVVFLSSNFLFNILVNKSYIGAKEYFPFLLLGFLFQSLYFLFANFIFYSKKTEFLAMITFSGALLNLILNYILIKIYGVIGIAYSNAITWFFFLLLVFMVFKRKFLNNASKLN